MQVHKRIEKLNERLFRAKKRAIAQWNVAIISRSEYESKMNQERRDETYYPNISTSSHTSNVSMSSFSNNPNDNMNYNMSNNMNDNINDNNGSHNNEGGSKIFRDFPLTDELLCSSKVYYDGINTNRCIVPKRNRNEFHDEIFRDLVRTERAKYAKLLCIEANIIKLRLEGCIHNCSNSFIQTFYLKCWQFIQDICTNIIMEMQLSLNPNGPRIEEQLGWIHNIHEALHQPWLSLIVHKLTLLHRIQKAHHLVMPLHRLRRGNDKFVRCHSKSSNKQIRNVSRSSIHTTTTNDANKTSSLMKRDYEQSKQKLIESCKLVREYCGYLRRICLVYNSYNYNISKERKDSSTKQMWKEHPSHMILPPQHLFSTSQHKDQVSNRVQYMTNNIHPSCIYEILFPSEVNKILPIDVRIHDQCPYKVEKYAHNLFQRMEQLLYS